MTPTLIGILLAVALAAVVLIIIGQRRTRSLREKFGPEYDQTVKSMKSRGKAESDLNRRIERVEELAILPLSSADRTRFEERWQADQARFVDDPRGAVKEADRLVAELMQVRGYPIADFEQRAADVSVHHPNVVSEYRAAHDIAERDAKGQANTEQLRKAMVHYRALFRDLLIVDAPVHDTARSATTRDRVLADSPEPPDDQERIIADRPERSIVGDRIIPDTGDARPDAR
jgi:gas vesicle protein